MFNIKCIEKKDDINYTRIKKGLILTKNPLSIKKFRAEVSILHHPTTIRVNYQPVVHCGGISQSAKICEIDKEYLRTGDKAKIRFKFMNRPEYIVTGTRLMFREGETKGVGKIVEVH